MTKEEWTKLHSSHTPIKKEVVIIKKLITLLSIIIFFGTIGAVTGRVIFLYDDTTKFTIGRNNSSVDPIFRHNMKPLYPGQQASKTLIIENDLEVDTRITSMCMDIRFNKDLRELGLNHEDKKDFMKHMNIMITYLNPLKSLSSGKIFEGSFSEFLLGKDCDINICKNNSLELFYTVSMSKEAEVNIEGIEGIIDFSFKIEQIINDDNEIDYIKE